MKEIKARSECPVSYALDFFGDRWSLLIMRDMILYDKFTYGDFLASDEKIATNILADRLSMLEANGFITKKVASDKKSKFLYLLTEKGISLVPVIMEISLWASQFYPQSRDKVPVKALKQDRNGFIQRLQSDLRKKMKTVG